MTKFILVGGYPAHAIDGGKAFCQEVVEGFDQPVRLLDCLFARPRETWEAVLEQDRYFFASNVPDRKILLTLAQPEAFVEQVRKADAIYFRGGSTRDLMKLLETALGWEKELEGKTVAGTSAGVDFLSSSYYCLDNLEIRNGLGILPIKALVHYGSNYNAPHIDWEKAYQELKESGDPSHEVLTLAEGEFAVREARLQ